MEPARRQRDHHLPERHPAATFHPHKLLETGDPFHEPDAPGNGVLEGTWTSDEHSGGAYDVTYNWHLEPE